MNNLEKVMYYFIKNFPQKLGRTMLIKAVYLLDCEWHKSYGESYSGLRYKRDYNGPFDTDFYEAKNHLCQLGLIDETGYTHSGGYGFEFSLLEEDEQIESEINSIALGIADEIVERLSNKDLKSFLDLAYCTKPMLEVLQLEEENSKNYGRVLDMSKNKEEASPLFDFSEIRDIAKKLDLSNRGSDEEYNRTITDEINDLAIFRERVEKVCQQVEGE
ncbi:hypothetical protein [Bacillus sp. AK031]